ncbi:ribonuclease H-like domain-containing protein [Tanacetum coccineum]
MLTTTEMRLKSRPQTTYVDSTSSSLMVLLANFCSNTRHSNSSTEKLHKPCFNFNKGSCWFGEHYKFLHNGVQGNTSLWSNSTPHSNVSSSPNFSTNDILTLQSLLAKLVVTGHISNGQSIITSGVQHSTSPMALHTTPTRSSPCYATFNSPPGFTFSSQAHLLA